MGILDNLESWLDFEEEVDKDPELTSGFATGKWSDDDDWHPITPFISPIR